MSITSENLHHAVLLLCLTCVYAAPAAELTVGPGVDHDFPSIQEAINAAGGGDVVLVADGTYVPQYAIAFHGKALTVRSMNGPDACVVDCRESKAGFVVDPLQAGAVLQGFTITGADSGPAAVSLHYRNAPAIIDCVFEDNTSGAAACRLSDPVFADCVFRRNTNSGDGGAVRCETSEPTFHNCLFEQNASDDDGGAVCSDDGSNPVIAGCTFIGNSAGDDGGAIGNYRNTRTAIVNCTFIGNVSRDNGGAVFSRSWSDPAIISCLFAGNSARSNGAAIYNRENLAVMANCVFTGNTARDSGGAVFNRETSHNAALLNCTMVNNTAGLEGGAVYNDLAMPELLNCIIWGNKDETGAEETDQIVGDFASLDYCCIQGWSGLWGGAGNHGQAPRFIDADGPDDVAGTEDDDLRLAPDSPCIDAGFSAPPSHPFVIDSDGYPRARGPAVDMGAYEFAPAGVLDGVEPAWPDLREEAIVINEALSHSPTGRHDWIELHNTTKRRICVGDWFLSDRRNWRAYQIAPGTYIEPGGYLVLHEETHFGNPNDPGSRVVFALNAEGGEGVYLWSGYGGLFTGYHQWQGLDAASRNVSLGRYTKSDGTPAFVPQSENTPGQPNAYPLVGPIVIAEIMYCPPSSRAEYVELHNIGDGPVAVAGWGLRRGKYSSMHSFPSDSPVTLPANGRLVIAKDPNYFAFQYGPAPADVPVVGPYSGDLSSSVQTLEITNAPEAMVVDRVQYQNSPPWPPEADGRGQSLQRIDPAKYGDDPENWKSGPPSPGR